MIARTPRQLKRTNLLRAAPAFGSIFLCITLLNVGCGSQRPRLDPRDVCAMFDSLYQTSGFEVPVTLLGKATIDADQYRLRGKVSLDVKPSGDVLVDFSTTILFGAQREDFFFSVVRDTVRIIDRERGHYYESESAEAFLAESLAMDFGVQNAIGLAMGRPPECESIDRLQMDVTGSGEIRFEGTVGGAKFQVVFGARDRRLQELRWPLRWKDRDDLLRVDYEWKPTRDGGERLDRVVMRLENREWRCILASVTD